MSGGSPGERGTHAPRVRVQPRLRSADRTPERTAGRVPACVSEARSIFRGFKSAVSASGRVPSCVSPQFWLWIRSHVVAAPLPAGLSCVPGRLLGARSLLADRAVSLPLGMARRRVLGADLRRQLLRPRPLLGRKHRSLRVSRWLRWWELLAPPRGAWCSSCESKARAARTSCGYRARGGI